MVDDLFLGSGCFLLRSIQAIDGTPRVEIGDIKENPKRGSISLVIHVERSIPGHPHWWRLIGHLKFDLLALASVIKSNSAYQSMKLAWPWSMRRVAVRSLHARIHRGCKRGSYSPQVPFSSPDSTALSHGLSGVHLVVAAGENIQWLRSPIEQLVIPQEPVA